MPSRAAIGVPARDSGGGISAGGLGGRLRRR
jgi:hypothetical protein